MCDALLLNVAPGPDNSFTLKVNGRQVLGGDSFQHIESADITSILQSGRNTITVVANNAASATRNPAGFIAAMALRYADGSTRVIATCSSSVTFTW